MLTSTYPIGPMRKPIPVIYSLAKTSTTKPFINITLNPKLQKYTSELSSNFSQNDVLSVPSTSTRTFQLGDFSIFKLGINDTEDLTTLHTIHRPPTTVRPPSTEPSTSLEDGIFTSARSTGHRTARQTTVVFPDRTSKISAEENVAFSPKPSFFKATIERVTIKPNMNNGYVKKQTLSAGLPSSFSEVKKSSETNRPSPNKPKPQIMIGDLFHNSLNKDSQNQKLVLYDKEYIKWLFNIFYREIKSNNHKSKATYTKVKSVFLNMLAEIGSVRSKWLNKSMAKHYATHFQRKEYDNKKRYTLKEEDLLNAEKNIEGLLAQHFNTEVRISSMIPKTTSRPYRIRNATNSNTMYSEKNSVGNLPLSFISSGTGFIDDKDRHRSKGKGNIKKWVPYEKFQNILKDMGQPNKSKIKVASHERVQSILIDARPYGGVSRNSGGLPTVAFKNDSENVVHKMQEYSMTRDAVLYDIVQLLQSLSGKNNNDLSKIGTHKLSSSSNALNIAHLPKDVSQLISNTIKRSKHCNIYNKLHFKFVTSYWNTNILDTKLIAFSNILNCRHDGIISGSSFERIGHNELDSCYGFIKFDIS